MSRAAFTDNPNARTVAVLHDVMVNAGVSADQLADGIGMRRHTLSRRMSGATTFYVCELAAISMYLKVPIGRLLGEG